MAATKDWRYKHTQKKPQTNSKKDTVDIRHDSSLLASIFVKKSEKRFTIPYKFTSCIKLENSSHALYHLHSH